MRWAVGLEKEQTMQATLLCVSRLFLSYATLGSEPTPWEDFSGMDYSPTLHRYTSILLFDMSPQNKYSILVVSPKGPDRKFFHLSVKLCR